MLRFIVYRYISYKDSKISHASPLALRHHLSQLPPALLPTSQPHDLPPALLPTSRPYYPPHCPTTRTRPTPLLGYLSQIRLPYLCAHDSLSTTALSPATQYYPAYCTHCTHVPHATPPCPSPPQMYHATPISYRLYHIALPRTPLSSI